MSYTTLPYVTPGFMLGKMLAEHIETLPRVPDIIFLENHGIILSADSMERCVALHAEVETHIQNLLDVDPADFSLHDLTAEEGAAFDSLTLFPDQVIYPAHVAIRAAHRFIVQTIARAGLHVRTLPLKEVDVVVGMDAEKHRKNLHQNL